MWSIASSVVPVARYQYGVPVELPGPDDIRQCGGVGDGTGYRCTVGNFRWPIHTGAIEGPLLYQIGMSDFVLEGGDMCMFSSIDSCGRRGVYCWY